MNYEPVGLSGSIWPRLEGGGPAGPLPALPETLLLCSPPRLLSTLLCAPYPCLMKKKGTNPSWRSPEQEVEFNLRKFPLVCGRHLTDQGPYVTCAEPSPVFPLSPHPPGHLQVHTARREGSHGGWGEQPQPRRSWPSIHSHPKPQVRGYPVSSSRVPGFLCFCFFSLKP